MMTCACCGQHLPSETPSGVFADEALLACCHQAADLARAEGSATIDIAHLVLALLHVEAARAAFAHHQIDIDDLARAAARQLDAGVYDGSNGTPEASAGFLQALRRAEQGAADANRQTVTLHCLVETLLAHALDLDGGAFVHEALVRMHQAHVAGQHHGDHDRQDAISRRRNRANDRTRDTDRGQHRHVGGDHAHGSAVEPAQSMMRDDSDPFQLRVDLASDTDTDSLRHETNVEPVVCTFSSADQTMTDLRSATLQDFDRRLRDMQQVLGAVAKQMQQVLAAQDRAAQRDSRARSERTRSRHSGSSDTMSRVRGPSDRDWERILRLLEHFDRGTASGQNDGGRSDRRSMNQRQRQTKMRIRASRQDWRRRRRERFERLDRNRPQSIWHAHDGARNAHQRLAMGSDDAFALQDNDWGEDEETGGKRFYLELDDEIVRAPSIGPRTAERLTPHGIERVRDLLAADPVALAERIGARHITTQRIEDWQMQARLVCTVPWLRGTHAQLLVGAGYTTPGDISAVSADELSADVLKFASTRDGQRVLRSGPPPEMERVVKWAEWAAEAELDRAA